MLEQQIDQILNKNLTNHWKKPRSINTWVWNFEVIKNKKPMDLHPTIREIHYIIENAPLEVCLTSPSEYIREYKKWFEREKDVRTTNR